MSAWLCVAEDEGLPISEATPQDKIERDTSGLLSMITVDTTRCRIETDTRMVGKRVAIPHWLAEYVDKRHINDSEMLKEALQSRL